MSRGFGYIVVAVALLTLGALSAVPVFAQAICPPGTYAARSRGKAVCVKGQARASQSNWREAQARAAEALARKTVTTTLGCAEFNVKFTAFHMSYAKKYGTQAFHQDQQAAQLRTLISSQERLIKELRTQAMSSRDVRIRRHLMAQSKEADAMRSQKQKELSELSAVNKSRQQKWTANYQARARRFLAQRPKGCKVAAAK